MIQFNKKEALRYFRAQSDDKSAETLIDAAYEKLKNELQPRFTVKRLGCRAEEASVLLDNGTVFHSKALARYVGVSVWGDVREPCRYCAAAYGADQCGGGRGRSGCGGGAD